ALADRLAALDRTRMSLGYTETLRRGFAVVRAEGAVVTTRADAENATALDIEFADGRLAATPGSAAKPRKPAPGDSGQGSLF
ncbi:MAG: exodeoxyribonuclease VII large subunit, partial [Rhodobacteraceae bacterium]|nr:exodeoxyribonuclease VII large subunit [Paracoccaceae bacterium]